MVDVQVTDKGEVPLPASVRKRYKIRPGTRLSLAERGNELVLTVDPKAAIEEVTGLLRGRGFGTQELLKQRSRDRRREDAKAKTRSPRFTSR